MNKLTVLGVISLIFIISSGCLGTVIVWDNVQETHTITVTSDESESCNISVNGIITEYGIPDLENKIIINGLNEGNNHVIVTCEEEKAEFDITVPVTTQPAVKYDEYNREYWNSRLK